MEKRIVLSLVVLLAIMVCLALCGPVSAAIVTVEVTGVVDRIEQNGLTKDDSINYGTVMSGFAVYDTETPDLDSSDFQGIYNLISISMSIGNYTLTDYSPPSDSALFDICYDGGPIWRVRSTTAGFDGEIIVNNAPHTCDDFDGLYIQILDAYGEYASPYSFSDRLPRSSLDLAPFEPLEGRFRMNFDNYVLHESLLIEGELTSMTLVYEPHEPTTYYVDGIDGNDLNDGLSHENAFATIQTAVDAAYDGDTVFVADGTYTGDGNRDIEVDRKGITIRSESGPENCIIDCNGSKDEPHTGFYFYRNIPVSSNLSGFTVTNGYRLSEGSGGILCNSSNVTIADCNISGNMVFGGRGGYGGGISVMDGIYLINNCTISNNSAGLGGSGGISCGGSTLTVSNCTINCNSGDYGGGINCDDSITTISDCSINNNFSRDGGGIGCNDSITTISNCTIRGNEAFWGGGIDCSRSCIIIKDCSISGNEANGFFYQGDGVRCYDNSNSTIINCIISGNAAGDNGAIYYENSTSTLRNCTVSGNIKCHGPTLGPCQAFGLGIMCGRGSNTTITNCILWGNEAGEGLGISFDGDDSEVHVTYSNVQGGWEGEGNIDAAPCFVDPGFWDANGTPDIWYDDFWIEGDYHLLPGSLCIDAGDPNYIAEPNETDLDGNPRVINGRIDMGAYEANYIQTRLWLLPRKINRQSRLKKVMAWVKLPEGITKDQVDQDKPLLLYPGPIEPIGQYIFEHGRKGKKRTSIFIVYDKAELMGAIPNNGLVDIQVIGSLNTSQQFYGNSFVTLIDRQQPRNWRLPKN